MPTTRKESLYFGLIMCFGMVLFMTLYNFHLNYFIKIIPWIRDGIIDK
ncbi:hypothetical protein ACOSZE_06710 [Lysinibacillus fusiformis]